MVPSVKSLVTNSSFSEAMSDKVTAGQQRKEEQNAMALTRDTSPISEELIRTGQWIQDTRGELTTSPQTEGFWPNCIITAANTTPPRKAYSWVPDDASSLVASIPTPPMPRNAWTIGADSLYLTASEGCSRTTLASVAPATKIT